MTVGLSIRRQPILRLRIGLVGISAPVASSLVVWVEQPAGRAPTTIGTEIVRRAEGGTDNASPPQR
jgi:hypothetical protein